MTSTNCIILILSSLIPLFVFGQDRAIDRDKAMKAVLEKYDSNGNGTFEKSEVAPLLKIYDQNGNGKLDRSERIAVAKDVLRAQANAPEEKEDVPRAHVGALTETLNEVVKRKQFAGCSFLVVHKGEVIFREAAGFADIESKRPFTTDELLPIASVSKPVLASVIMALVDQGKLKLDDPVANTLPAFKGKRVERSTSAAPPITLRHLLAHTAGFWGNKKIPPEKLDLIRNMERPLADAVNGIASYDLVSEPGKKFIYSGSGYCVAGRVAEVTLGQSLEEIAQEVLFRPMGMKRTTFLPSADIRKTLPTAYARKDGGLQKQASFGDLEELRFILPGGSLFATMDDLAAFAQMHLNDGVYQGQQILSEASVAEMRRLQIPEGGTKSYGLGWNLGDHSEPGPAEFTSHSGALGAKLHLDHRRDLVTVFLVHSASGGIKKFNDRLLDQVNEMIPLTEGR